MTLLPTPVPVGQAVDRAAHRRSEPDLVERLAADPTTRVVLVLDGQVAASGDSLALARPGGVPWDGGDWYFLGMDDGAAYLAAVAGPDEPSPATRPQHWPGPAGAEPTWVGLRGFLAGAEPTGADLATTAVALAGWHAGHGFCPRCGLATVVEQAGWTRVCANGHTVFPRTDPAVIMAVLDGEEILLGHNAHWPAGRFSTLAGFVEPGESLEEAVRREVREETAVDVAEVDYAGSQPWPFPSSLMVAFNAHARTRDVDVDGIEVTEAQWFTRARLADQVAQGAVLLPPGGSIARALIQNWYGGPIDGSW